MHSLSFRVLLPAFLALAAALALATLLSSGGRSGAQSGQWLNFPGPGPGWIEVPHDAALSPTAAITIEAWVNLRSYDLWGTELFCPGLVGKDFSEAYWMGVCAGRLRLLVRGQNADSAAPLPLNAWTHVAATYDGMTIRLYINGELDSEQALASPGPITTSADPLRIGHDVSWNASPDGLIDEVRLWNIARPAMSIQATKDTTITTAMPGLVAVWNMDGNAADAVGGHDGTPHGSVEFIDIVPSPSASLTPSPTAPATPTPTASPTPSPEPSPTPTPTPLPTPSPSPSPTPEPQLKGDMDCDGDADSVDALHLLRHVADLPSTLPPGCTPVGTLQ